MKLYIWEGVLEDYTSGLLVVMAESMEEAVRLAKARVSSQYGSYYDKDWDGSMFQRQKPRVSSKAVAVSVSGVG